MKILSPLFLAFIFFIGIGWISPGKALANGWEHFAIPLKSLLQVLEGDSMEGRIKAAKVLGIRKEQEAVEPLLKLLSEPETSPQMRSAFYDALGKIADNQAASPLVQALKNEVRPELRAEAASALGGLKTPKTLPALLQALQEDPSFIVRTRIVDTLGVFPQEDSIEALTQLLKEKNTTLKIRAIRALGLTQSKHAVKPLIRLLEQTKNQNLRIEIVDALGHIGDPASAEVLTQMLEETSHFSLRLSLILALGAVQDGSTAPVLIRLLEDPSLEVLHFAILGIQKNYTKSAALPLKQLFFRLSDEFWAISETTLLQDPVSILQNIELQTLILRTLTEVAPEMGLSAFLKGAQFRKFSMDSSLEFRFNDAIYELRRMALVGLGYTKDVKAVDFFMKDGPLQDPDPRLRAAAVRSLGVLGESKAIEVVLTKLQDDSPDVRWISALVLGRMQDLRAIPALRHALDDSHSLVRQEAILSLGYLGDTEIQNRIKTLSENDESLRVRQAAKEYLQMQ